MPDMFRYLTTTDSAAFISMIANILQISQGLRGWFRPPTQSTLPPVDIKSKEVFKGEVRAKVSRALRDKNQLLLAELAIIEAEASGGCVLNPVDLPYNQNRQVFLYLAGATYANQVAIR